VTLLQAGTLGHATCLQAGCNDEMSCVMCVACVYAQSCGGSIAF